MNAIISGSRAYGTPTEESDVDLVVRCSPDAADALCALFDSGESRFYNGSAQVKVGKLNLLCTTDQAFATWVYGTAKLKAKRPVERAEACRLFKALREGLQS
jgi:Nucleotidyltransferase domain